MFVLLGILAHRYVALYCYRKYKTNFNLKTMNTSTENSSNEAENGNKSSNVCFMSFGKLPLTLSGLQKWQKSKP